MSFLMSVAHGYARVSHRWVLDSVLLKEKQNMKNYFLPMRFR